MPVFKSPEGARLNVIKKEGQIHLVLSSQEGLSFEADGTDPESAADNLIAAYNAAGILPDRWERLGFQEVVNEYLQTR